MTEQDNETAGLDMPPHLGFINVSDTGSVQCRTDDQFFFVEQQRTIDGNGYFPPVYVELPTIPISARKTSPDTGMMYEIGGSGGRTI